MKYLAFIAIFLMITACQEDTLDQEVYFEYSYINYAWGASYEHWILDKHGNVRINSKDSIVWIRNGNSDPNIALFDSVVFTVSKNQLAKHTRLIPGLAQSNVSVEEQQMRDFGSHEFNAFFADEVVVIKHLSDRESKTNTHQEAEDLHVWLNSVTRSLREQK